MAGDPSNVCPTPVDIVVLDVEDQIVRGHGAGEISALGVHDPFRRPCRPRRVQDVQEVLGVHHFGLRGRGLAVDQVVPPHVAPIGHGSVVGGALDNHHMLDRRACRHRHIAMLLQREHGTFAPRPVLGDQQFGPGVLDPLGQRVSGEPSEHHGVDGADAGTGEHRDRKLRDHPHVNGDPVPPLDAERSQPVGELAHLLVELGVGEVTGVAGFSDPVIGDLVADGVEVAVETVVRQVERAVFEPLEERRVGVVEPDGRLRVPGDPVERLLHPPGLPIGGLVIDAGSGVRRAGE